MSSSRWRNSIDEDGVIVCGMGGHDDLFRLPSRYLEVTAYDPGSRPELLRKLFSQSFHYIRKEVAKDYICFAEVYSPEILKMDGDVCLAESYPEFR